MAELVDAPDLGSGFARSEGSSPFIRIMTKFQPWDVIPEAVVLWRFIETFRSVAIDLVCAESATAFSIVRLSPIHNHPAPIRAGG